MELTSASQSQFSPVAPDILIVHRWPPHSFRQNHMRAYRLAEDAGIIHVRRVLISKSTGAAGVELLSTIPDPLLKQQLRAFFDQA